MARDVALRHEAAERLAERENTPSAVRRALLQDSPDIAAALPAEHMQLATFAHSGHGAWRDEPDAALARLRSFILEG